MILLFRLLSPQIVMITVLVSFSTTTSMVHARDTPVNDNMSGTEESTIPVKKLKFPAVIPQDAAGDHVWEIQTTLNSRLGSRTIRLGKKYSIGPIDGGGESGGKGVRLLTTPDRRELRIRGNWQPGTLNENKEFDTVTSSDKLPAGKTLYLRLPEEPLHPAGIYGEQTYALIMMFQISKNLQPTGELDAVTLGQLEPIIPSSPLLRPIMQAVEQHLFTKDSKKGDYYAVYVKRYTAVIATLLIVVAAVIAYVAMFIAIYLAKRMTTSEALSKPPQSVARLLPEATSHWFAALRGKNFFTRLAHFAPAVLIYFAAGIFPARHENGIHAYSYVNTFEYWNVYVARAGLAYIALAFTLVNLAFINVCEDVFRRAQDDEGANDSSSNSNNKAREGTTARKDRNMPTTTIAGIARFAWRTAAALGVVLICSALLGRNPMYIVGGLGVFTAVIMLVFKDSLLGLVASVQIVANHIVEVGDWIEMPKYGADGDVVQITLSTIKVKNFDKTISNIPTHTVLSESFRNFRNIYHEGGRRIKRAINIDMHSIKICTPEMVKRFKSIPLISEFVRRKEKELSKWLNKKDAAPCLINSRRPTNIGVFRAYVEAYLASREDLHPVEKMTSLVRHLQPSEKGLPIEIYAFCRETSMAKYEAIQADIFDHVLSVLPDFELSSFQDSRHDISDSSRLLS